MPTIIASVTVGAVDTVPGPPAKPDATNTGWSPTGVTLTAYPTTGGPAGSISGGILSITTPNIVLDSYDFPCLVNVAAANVKIKRSRVRGPLALPSGSSYGLLQCTSAACVGALFEDVEVVPQTPSTKWTGIIGHDYTARRCNIYRSVDSGGGFNTTSSNPVNVLYENSFMHDHAYFSPDPGHPNDQPVSASHSDGYQGQGGSGHTFRYCTIDGMCDTTIKSADGSATADILRPSTNKNSLGGYSAIYPWLTSNSGFQFTQPATPVGSPVANVTIDSCWIGGGGYCINFGPGVYNGVTIINNKFARTMRVNGTAISVPNAATNVTIGGNVWEDDGTPAKVVRY